MSCSPVLYCQFGSNLYKNSLQVCTFLHGYLLGIVHRILKPTQNHPEDPDPVLGTSKGHCVDQLPLH